MGQGESLYHVHEASSQMLLSKDYDEDVNIDFFEDLFYSLTDEFLLSSFTPGFIRILISSKPNNVFALIKRIYRDFLLFLDNPNPLYYSDIITRIQVLTIVLSVFFEVSFSDKIYDFFWRISDPSTVPFGRILIHTIMRLLFIDVSYPPSVTPEKITKVTNTLSINRVLLWSHGVGSKTPIPKPLHVMLLRSSLLRLILLLNSSVLYHSTSDSSDIALGRHHQWVIEFLSPSLPYQAEFFLSLLNTIFSYNPPLSSSSATLSVSSLAIFQVEKEYVSLAVRVLLVLILHEPPSSLRGIEELISSFPSSSSSSIDYYNTNFYTYNYVTISNIKQLDYILGSLVAYGQAPFLYVNTSFTAGTEYLLLLYELIKVNTTAYNIFTGGQTPSSQSSSSSLSSSDLLQSFFTIALPILDHAASLTRSTPGKKDSSSSSSSSEVSLSLRQTSPSFFSSSYLQNYLLDLTQWRGCYFYEKILTKQEQPSSSSSPTSPPFLFSLISPTTVPKLSFPPSTDKITPLSPSSLSPSFYRTNTVTPKLKFLKRRVLDETDKRKKERTLSKVPLGPIPHVTVEAKEGKEVSTVSAFVADKYLQGVRIQIEIVQSLVSMLLPLSSNMNVNTAMNETYKFGNPRHLRRGAGRGSGEGDGVLINTEWCFSDSLILSLLDVCERMLTKDFPLVQQCLTIINNLTYFTTSLARATSSQLLNLFVKIAHPDVLYNNVNYFVLVHLLLESFNNIIQYHIGENPYFLYFLELKSGFFEGLANPNVTSEGEEETEEKKEKEKGEEQGGVVVDTLQKAYAASPSEMPAPWQGDALPPSSYILKWHRCLPLLPILAVTRHIHRHLSKLFEEAQIKEREKEKPKEKEEKNKQPQKKQKEGEDGEKEEEKGGGEEVEEEEEEEIGGGVASLPVTPQSSISKSKGVSRLMDTAYYTFMSKISNTEYRGYEEREAIQKIRRISFVGILPEQHKIVMKEYTQDAEFIKWMKGLVWRIVYSKTELLWDANSITFFAALAQTQIMRVDGVKSVEEVRREEEMGKMRADLRKEREEGERKEEEGGGGEKERGGEERRGINEEVGKKKEEKKEEEEERKEGEGEGEKNEERNGEGEGEGEVNEQKKQGESERGGGEEGEGVEEEGEGEGVEEEGEGENTSGEE